MAYKDAKDFRKLLMKFQGASTNDELLAMGAEFSTSFESWLIYKHPALGEKCIFYKRQYAKGRLTLVYDFIK